MAKGCLKQYFLSNFHLSNFSVIDEYQAVKIYSTDFQLIVLILHLKATFLFKIS